MSTPFDNWDVGAIIVDVPVGKKYELKQVGIKCSWCGKGHFAVLEDERRYIAGHHFCDNCGQFFKFEIHKSESRTRRVRARPKLGGPTHGTIRRLRGY